MNRINFLNCKIDLLTMEETLKIIQNKIDNNEFLHQVVINVAKLIHIQNNIDLKNSVNNSDIINIDGMGIIYGANFLNYNINKNFKVSGIDLFYKLLELSEKKKYKIFLLGGTDHIIKKTVINLKQNYKKLNIAGYHHGYFWENEEEIVGKINDSKANLLFVAITSPKKEIFIEKWKKELKINYVMGVGGTFDIVAGKSKRAPKWMQNFGLEWFYRILQEPKRMWKRYLITNSIYFYLLLKEKLRNAR